VTKFRFSRINSIFERSRINYCCSRATKWKGSTKSFRFLFSIYFVRNGKSNYALVSGVQSRTPCIPASATLMLRLTSTK